MERLRLFVFLRVNEFACERGSASFLLFRILLFFERAVIFDTVFLITAFRFLSDVDY